MAEQPPDNLDWLRKKQFDEVSLQFRTAWGYYLNFYTVFTTVNITALGITIQYVHLNNRWPIVVVFLLQNLNSCITATRLAQYSKVCESRMQSICLDIADLHLQQTGTPPPIKAITQSSIPGQLGYWGGIANAMGHILFIICWGALLY